MESPRCEPVPIWDAWTLDGGLAHWDTVQAQHLPFWFWGFILVTDFPKHQLRALRKLMTKGVGGGKKQEILDHPLFPKPLPYSLLFQLPPVLWRNFTGKWAFAKSSPSSKNAYGCICQHIRKAHILLFSQMPIILGIKWKELGNNLPVVTRAKAAINSRTLQSQPKDCPILTIYRNLQRKRECPFAIRYLKSFHFLIKGGCQNSIEGI